MDDTANRRSFLIGSAASLGASALKAAESNQIRAAFIGVGNRGGALLQQTLRQENARLGTSQTQGWIGA